MIEATVIFKNGIQLHLSLTVFFEDMDNEIETNSKIGFVEFNEMDERILHNRNCLINESQLFKKRWYKNYKI